MGMSVDKIILPMLWVWQLFIKLKRTICGTVFGLSVYFSHLWLFLSRWKLPSDMSTLISTRSEFTEYS